MDPLKALNRPAAFVPPPPPPPPPPPKEKQAPVSKDSYGITSILKSAAPDGVKDLYNDALPWIDDKTSKIGNALSKFAAALGVDQHWPHSCTAAAVQAGWKQNDAEGYRKAEAELMETGSTIMPGPPPVEVKLDPNTRSQIDQDCEDMGYSDGQKAEMYMQAALMEYGTQGTWSPATDDLSWFDGTSQAGFERMAGAAGLELTNTSSLNIRTIARQLKGEDVSRGEVLDDMLQENFAANPDEPVLLTVNVDGTNHGVKVTRSDDGQYYVRDGEGNPMPPGVEQPMSAEKLEQYVPADGDDVAGRRAVAAASGDGSV